MPIDASPSGTLDIENATLRSREIVALTNMVAGNDVVRSLNPPTLEIYGDPEPTLELVSNVNDVSASAFARLTSNAGVFSIQSGVNQEIDSKGDIAFTSINGNSEHMRIVGSTGRIGIGTTNPTSNLHVMGDINLEHVSNVATLKVNSNVVTEFNRSKKLIKYPRVALTSAAETGGYQGYIVTRSSQFSSYNAWEAFDENNPVGTGQEGAGSGWASTIPGTYSVSTGAETGSVEHHTGSVQGEWIQIQLPESIYLHDFVIESRSETTYNTSGFDHGFPEKVVLYGSNDGSSWVSIKTFTTVDKNHSKAHTENINETTQTYKYFALVVNSIHVFQNTTQVSHVSIGQIRLFGVPEYDPEAHGTDVVVKSVPNVPNTDWLEVYYDAKDFSGAPSSITDKSGNNITATANNITIDATYNSFEFTQSPKSNIIADNVTFVSGDKSHSIVLWVRLKNGNANNLLFDYRVAGGTSTTGAATGLYILNSNKRLNFYHQGTDKVVDLDFEQNRWYHITGTYAGGGGFTGSKIYIDGVDVGGVISGTDSVLVLPATGTITIGDFLYNNTYGLGDGSIANFRLFNRALTSDEIWQLYAYQKEYFGHGALGMTLKNGRLGIGTSDPKATLDIRGDVMIDGYRLTSMYPGFASGGDDVYDVDGYRIHVFTNSGTFTVPGKNISADVLVVGGGGGGGQDNAGGGGAGGLIFKPNHTFAGRGISGGRDGAYIITIGSGGAGSPHQNSGPPAQSGGDTTIKNLRSTWGADPTYTTQAITNIFTGKGGAPGNSGGSTAASSLDGGSGGGQDGEVNKGLAGGIGTQPSQSGDSGTYGYGNNGGASNSSDAGGGGGGAGSPGETPGGTIGGNGGNGLSGVGGYDFAEIYGTRYGEVVDENVYFAGGGAGANKNAITSSFARGGLGGGGTAGATPSNNENGLPGTGGGGAGAFWDGGYQYNLWGGNGGSGIVMIRYKL